MGDTAQQITRHIEQQRRELRDTMVELEDKVSRAVDWREHVQQRPMTMIGLAFGGGVLLSALLGGTSRSRNRSKWSASHFTMPEDAGAVRRPREASAGTHRERSSSATWENLKGALVGVAVARAGSAVEHLLPGFGDEYRKAQAGSDRGQARSHTP